MPHFQNKSPRVRSSEGVPGDVGALLRVCGSCGIQPLPPFTTVNKQIWVSWKQWRVQLLSCVRTPLATLEPWEMIKRIQLALEILRAGPRCPGLNSTEATPCPGISPRRRQSIQPNERQEEVALLAWQAAALELGTHGENSQNFPRTPQSHQMLGIWPCFGKGSCSAQHHSGWLSPRSSRDVACFLERLIWGKESENRLLLLQNSGPFHRVHSWSSAPGWRCGQWQ